MSKRNRTEGRQKPKPRKRTSKKKETDVNKLINIAVKTGKTIIGTRTLKKYMFTSDLKLIILAGNCPEQIKKEIILLNNMGGENKTPIYIFPGSSWELGTAAGKPFMVAAMGIIEPGDSQILDVLPKLPTVQAETA